jgi:polysaccharide biosynthesis/export protein
VGGFGVSSRSVIVNSGLCLLFWSICCFAVNAGPTSSSEPPKPQADSPPRIIQIGPGDSVGIQVYGQPDMTTVVYVSDDGTIPVSLAGPVQIAGLSPSEASKRIEKALKDGNFLVDPHVTLTVTVSRSQRVSVLGQVARPGVYPIESNNTTIFNLLALAGGALDTASEDIFLLRTDANGTLQRFPINLKGLEKASGVIPEQALRGGDSILVPKADQFYIYGEVTAPNKYRVERDMTVIEAIARAGGVTPRGSERRVDIKRLVDGKYLTVKAKLNDPVKADDVIHVKESIF